MNSIIKKIVEDAIEKVNKIKSNEDLTMEEKQDEVNIVLENTKKSMTNLEKIFQTSLKYVNDLLDYAITKKSEEEELKLIKQDLNNSKNNEELKNKIKELYNLKIPSGTAKIYNNRMIEILTTYGFTKKELETIERPLIKEGLLDNMLNKVDEYSKSIKEFINKKDLLIEGENELLSNIDNYITERTLMDTNEGIEKYREKIIDIYKDLQEMQKEKKKYNI